MQGNKCKNCGLVNLSSDKVCRRCSRFVDGSGSSGSDVLSPREAAKRSSSLYTLLVLTVIAAGVYYLYSEIGRSFEKVNTVEADRIATQPQPAPLTTRSEADKQRTQSFKTAIQNSPGIAQTDKRLAETKKLMEPAR